MTNKNKSLCYGSLVEKIMEIDLTMENLEGTIQELKKSLSFVSETDEEICPDEIGSEKALLELLKDACVDAMIDGEPEGEA
jgi:hypothetical protein